MKGLVRGHAAIVGVAESDLGAVAEGMSPIDLMAQGVYRALDDAGLKIGDVDGLFAATSQVRLSALALSEYLKISPAYLDSTIVGGSSFMFHVAHAQAAIQQGLCEVAVIAYGSTQRTVGRKSTPPLASTIPTKLRSSPSCRRAPMPSPRRGTCSSSAPPASSLPRSRWRRATGLCSIPRRGRRSR